MVYICGCIPARIRHALADLPETLDEAYERALREINKSDWEFAHRMFQFIAVASRPLRVEELAELLAFDFKVGPIPKFRENWRVEDPVGAVLSICSSLLAIVDGGSLPETADGGSLSELSPGPPPETDDNSEITPSEVLEDDFFPEGTEDGYRDGKFVQFSHNSVKEFLMSARLAESDNIISRRYYVSMTFSHTLAAQACLGILLHLDEDVAPSDSLAKWPLAKYAAGHWVNHARFEGVWRNVEDGMKQLFDPRKPHLARCLRLNDPDRSLLEQRRQAESPLISQGTPLHYAALWGFDFIGQFLIVEHSQDVNTRDFANEMTPLHLASMRGHGKIARMLVERGAEVNSRNGTNDMTPLHLASMRGHVEIARMLVERGAEVNSRNGTNDITPLHLASMRGHENIALLLLGYGAEVNYRYGANDMTPFHLASIRGHENIALLLLEHGAEVNSRNGANDMTPLHLASMRGHVKIALILLEHGADADAQNGDRMSPTDMALAAGHVEVAGMLNERGTDVTAQDEDRNVVERGAGVTAQDKCGETPLHLASLMGRVEVARKLIERGADFTARDNDGKTPLHWASQMGQTEVVRMLVERGAYVAAKDKAGKTPSQLASQHGKEEVLRMLMELGADATAQHDDGETELASTLSSSPENRRSQDNASVDIKHGADENAPNTDGSTPSHLASQGGLAAFKHVPLDHGADPGKMPASKSPPVTSPAQSPSDLPIPDPGEKPVSESPPATSLTRTLAYCSLGIVAIAVVLHLLIRFVSRTSVVGRST